MKIEPKIMDASPEAEKQLLIKRPKEEGENNPPRERFYAKPYMTYGFFAGGTLFCGAGVVTTVVGKSVLGAFLAVVGCNGCVTSYVASRDESVADTNDAHFFELTL